MLTTLFKSIGLAGAQEPAPLMPRQVNLSGNIVHFAMPENFSKDFPAKDLRERLTLENPKEFDERFDCRSAILMERWWDFKTDGFFKKDAGTVMMVLSVQKIPGELKKNIAIPTEFVEVLWERLNQMYDEFNRTAQDDEKIYYSQYYNEFPEFLFNNQRWIRYSHTSANDHGVTVGYSIPIDQHHYLVAVFSAAPASTMSLRQFDDEFYQPLIDRIMGSFHIDYSEGNTFVKELKKYEHLELRKMIEEMTPKDVPAFKPMLE